jgi:hypothetical protein
MLLTFLFKGQMVIVDLSNGFELKETKGLWPGFELSSPTGQENFSCVQTAIQTTKDDGNVNLDYQAKFSSSILCHCESLDEAKEWILHLKAFQESLKPN